MRAILVYYMTKQLLIGQEYASFIYGFYTAFAYFTPIVGGVIADRWLGRRRAVIIGGSIMAIGHFLMASESLFYVALATIALGNGLFLPSLPSQIADLYKRDDPRRGWAYNVYYVGINVGGLLAPLICGTLGEVYGWHYGFGAAGIGMVLGLVIYIMGGKYLPPEQPKAEAAAEAGEGVRSAKRTYLLLLGVGLAVTVFRGAYEQVGNTMALWADSGVDRAAGAFVIPMTWFQALNPLIVIAFTPLLLAYWRRKAEAGQESRPLRRMAMGAMLVGLSYLLVAAVSAWHAGELVSWIWFALFFLILTVGELYILPTGLGLFARFAPIGHGATTVAAWYFAIFTGSLFAGAVGALWSTLSNPAFFLLLAGIAGIAGLLLLLLDAPFRKVEDLEPVPEIPSR
jgi:POT family proton-dependent oligopeptide transporter